MKDLTFFSVLKDNLRCAACSKKNCWRRYQPNRRSVLYHDGYRVVDECPKTNEKKTLVINSMA